MLNETYIDNITDLPYSSGVPNQTVQASGHIRGWIDIVGFNETVRDNGTDYVPGDPAYYAIVLHDEWADLRCCRICSSRIEAYTTVISVSENTVASLHIKLIWYKKICTEDGCYCKRYDEYIVFQDTETSPQVYQPINRTFIVNITQYNNSMYENIGIYATEPENIGKTVIKYYGNISTHITKIGHVEQTNKSVYFANITYLDSWNVTRFGKINGVLYMNGNLSKINLTDIKITGSNLYENMPANASQYNSSRVEFTPEKELTNTLLYGVLGIMAAIAWGIYYLIIRVLRTW